MGIVAKNISKDFGFPPTRVLDSVNLEVHSGEFVSLVGKSGSGKSTLLYILSTLDSPTQGELIIDGKALTKFSEQEVHRFRNQNMGFVFQFHYLLPELTALENVLMPTVKAKIRSQKVEQAKGLLAEFGLSEKFDRLPRSLSGGEQQRVAIARALIMEPKYVFADEPTGNLDSVNGDLVMGILERISKEWKTSILMVTHDNDFAARAQRQIHLSDGKID